jgi:hypothetical protein
MPADVRIVAHTSLQEAPAVGKGERAQGRMRAAVAGAHAGRAVRGPTAGHQASSFTGLHLPGAPRRSTLELHRRRTGLPSCCSRFRERVEYPHDRAIKRRCVATHVASCLLPPARAPAAARRRCARARGQARPEGCAPQSYTDWRVTDRNAPGAAQTCADRRRADQPGTGAHERAVEASGRARARRTRAFTVSRRSGVVAVPPWQWYAAGTGTTGTRDPAVMRADTEAQRWG